MKNKNNTLAVRVDDDTLARFDHLAEEIGKISGTPITRSRLLRLLMLSLEPLDGANSRRSDFKQWYRRLSKSPLFGV